MDGRYGLARAVYVAGQAVVCERVVVYLLKIVKAVNQIVAVGILFQRDVGQRGRLVIVVEVQAVGHIALRAARRAGGIVGRRVLERVFAALGVFHHHGGRPAAIKVHGLHGAVLHHQLRHLGKRKARRIGIGALAVYADDKYGAVPADADDRARVRLRRLVVQAFAGHPADAFGKIGDLPVFYQDKIPADGLLEIVFILKILFVVSHDGRPVFQDPEKRAVGLARRRVRFVPAMQLLAVLHDHPFRFAGRHVVKVRVYARQDIAPAERRITQLLRHRLHPELGFAIGKPYAYF